MLRRDFFTSLTLLGAAFGINKLPLSEGAVVAEKVAEKKTAITSTATQLQPPTLLLQTCAVAGFQYHQGEMVWHALSPTQPLTLVRESDNAYDERAVRIVWRGHKIGYMPRKENAVVAGLLDRGERLTAKVAQVKQSDDPWQPVMLDIGWACE